MEAGTESTTPALHRQRATLPVARLTSLGVRSLERALRNVPGVIRAYANPATEMAYVEYDPLLTGPASLEEAIESAGFRNGEEAPPAARSDAAGGPPGEGATRED